MRLFAITFLLLVALQETIGYFQNDVVIMNISKWPAATIPYKLSTGFTKKEVKMIASVLRKFRKTTCLKFIPRTKEVDFVHFRKTRAYGECGGKLGRVGGEQLISLAPEKCISRVSIATYVMRTLGFFPEDLREDRDHYIKINWGNVRHRKIYDLWKIRGALYDLKMPYDYYSILHHKENIFAIDDNQRTIYPHYAVAVVFGHPQSLSWQDIAKIQSVYCSPEVIRRENGPEPRLVPCEWNNC